MINSRCGLHTTTTMVELCFKSTSSHNYHTHHNFFLPSHTTTLVVEKVDLTSTIVQPIGVTCGEETNNLLTLVASLYESNCFLQILSQCDMVNAIE